MSMNLNTGNWKEFRLGNLFSEMYKAEAHVKADLECFNMFSHNTIKFISRTEMNNGCDCYVLNNDLTGIEEGNAISIGDTTATCFYQSERFICGDHMVICRAGWLNKYTALFVLSILKQEKYKYSYGRAYKMDLISNTVIKLPATADGSPDWDFMERYIKSLNYKPLTTQNNHPQHPLNIDSWQEFRLDDLFSEIYKAEAHVKGDLEFVESPGANTIKFISRTEMNNGCDCYLPNNGISGIENGNAITIGDTTATCFYQKDEFVCGDHIVVCRSEWLNLYTGLFLVSLLKREKYKYNYGRAFKMDLISNTKVKLPTKSDGTPDFNYMEHYMKLLPYGDRI